LQPEITGLSSACAPGNPAALWIREVLPVGWGDTYGQFVSGQAFDITSLPNGAYFIRVTANPDERLYEATLDNNISLREVLLGGAPGARTVEVPPYEGIDTEAQLVEAPVGSGQVYGAGEPVGHPGHRAAAAGWSDASSSDN
jgi:hypothetical protein